MDILSYARELEEDNDKLQQIYQDEHCDNLKYKELLNKIKEFCKEPNLPCYNPESEYGIGRIDLGMDIIEIIEEELDD